MAEQIQFEPVSEDKIDFQPITFEPIKSEEGLWQKANTPLADLRGGVMKDASNQFATEHPIIGGGMNFLADTISSLSSPISLGLGALTGGANLAESAGLAKLADILNLPGKAAAGGMVVHGGYNVLAPSSTIQQRIGGALEAGLGGLGFHGLRGVPEVETPTDIIKSPKIEGLAPKPQLALPSAPESIINPPKFIAGEKGIAENRPYPIDIGPINPAMGAKNVGTVLPHELGQINQIPPEMAAMKGLEIGEPIQSPASRSAETLIPQSDRFNIGDPNLPAQLPSAEKTPRSKVFEEAPASIDEVNSSPVEVKSPEQTVLPEPGQATPSKDISGFTANYSSPDITLASRPETKPIADVIIKAQDQKMNWIATTERELADLSKGLSKSDRVALGQMIDGQVFQTSNPELALRAKQARIILDSVHDMFPEGATRSGENVGYLENYFTHIYHQPDDLKSGLQSIVDHHFGPIKSPGNLPSTEGAGTGDLFDKGLGRASSPYVEERKGLESQLQYDVNKVFPAYIESAAKVIFDKPAIEEARSQLAKIPDSNLKELATWYIKNYSNYDSLPGLHKAWNSWASTIARTTSRSLLGFNTGLQTLHLARIPANLWPELGTKFSTIGLKEVASHPIQAWTEAAQLGLLQNEIRPFNFRTPMEKFDSISNFLSLADYLDKAIGYHGYKAKMLAQGMEPEAAKLEALKFTKRVSQTSDAARQMKGMSVESNVMGGEVASRLGWQFKQVPAKIVEQYVNIARNAGKNPQSAARMIAGVSFALAANEGMRTFHIDPMHMVPSGAWGAFGTTVNNVVRALAKGDWQRAVEETVLWATPGGKSIQRQLENGPSALNPIR